MGREDDARVIRVAMNTDRLRFGKMSLGRRIWLALLGATIGYGYLPARATVWMAGIVLLGTALFRWAYRRDDLQPTQRNTPRFNSFWYSLDTFLPIIDFKQADYWLPTSSGMRWYSWIQTAFGWLLSTALVAGLTGLVR
jgi:hypothetical protein